MKFKHIIFSGLAGLALTLTACNPESSDKETDKAPEKQNEVNGSPGSGSDKNDEAQTVSLKVTGMT